jgi:hypothetical protein
VKWRGDVEPTKWEYALFIPVDSCLETPSLGPVPMNEVEWVEIDPIEIQHFGRFARDRRIDHSDQLRRLLEENGIHFERVEAYFRFNAARS